MLDFHDLGRYRENNRIEAKKAQGGLPHSIWETYSAFANTVGGVILLGVVEKPPKKTLQPVPLPDPQRLVDEFWALLNDPAVVSVNILRRQDVQILEVGGLPIVAIEVPRATRRERPVYIGRDPMSGTYQRSGEGDYHCTPQQVRAMLAARGGPSRDSLLVNQFGPNAFCWDTVARYRRQMDAVRPGHRWKDLDHLAFLCQIGAAGYDKNRHAHPTAAGLLMFGKSLQIRMIFPHYDLEYREPDPGAPSVRRISTWMPGWSGNLFDFYLLVSARLKEAELPGGAPVQSALRQAVTNALVHADYGASQRLLVLRRSESILISNPGCLRVAGREAIAPGVSSPRNENLMEMFRLVEAAHARGSGLPDIHRVWKQQGWREPVLQEFLSPDSTLLTLRFPRLGAKNPPRESAQARQAILDYLRDQVQARPTKIARALQLPRPQVDAMLCRLMEDDLVTSRGVGRGRVYRLKG